MQYYLGLDVHSKKTSYCLQDSTGTLKSEGGIISSLNGFSMLKDKFAIPEGTKVALESGTQMVITVAWLYELGFEPIVINAEEVRKKARRVGQKTDRRDAFEICDGLRRGIYDNFVYVPEPGIARLRMLLSRRRHYVKIATMEVNAAKFIVRVAGLSAILKSLATEKAWMKLLENPLLLKEHKSDIGRHFMTWKHAKEILACLEADLTEAAKPYETIIKRLQTMPGVGPVTAWTFFATIGRVDRFADSNHLVSYLGLAPSMYDSGGSKRHGGITKRGSTAARSILCEVAHHAARQLHPLRPYFMRVFAKHGRNRAVVAVAHRTARILYQMWRREEDFNSNKLNVEIIQKRRVEEKFVIKRPVAVMS